MRRLLHIVYDYLPGDMAGTEVQDAIDDEIDDGVDVRFITTSVASFDTIATGFVLCQLARRSRKKLPALLFGNCAPRKDNARKRSKNEGEPLVYALLDNGAELLVVNSGFSLSFVKPYITRLYKTKASPRGSQFRSRDNFPAIIGSCLNSSPIRFSEGTGAAFNPAQVYDFLDKPLDVASIPDAPERVVAYIDSFGNLKTSTHPDDPYLKDLKMGTRLRVIVGNTVRYATITDGSFGVPEGDIALAPGSSGHDNHFIELFKRGGSAQSEYGCSTGAPIEFQTL